MQRLTTNKEASEMSMYELAHNSCYAKDRKARYRDYDTDIDARKLTIKLLDKFAGVPNEFTCDEDFDDFMLDSLQYGTDNIQGLIAIFYQNLWAMADLRERLKEYEDLEEQGKLPKLPCAVGDTVYVLWNVTPEKRVIHEAEVREIRLGTYMARKMVKYLLEQTSKRGKIIIFYEDDFGKTVFLTREEAEATLKEL